MREPPRMGERHLLKVLPMTKLRMENQKMIKRMIKKARKEDRLQELVQVRFQFLPQFKEISFFKRRLVFLNGKLMNVTVQTAKKKKRKPKKKKKGTPKVQSEPPRVLLSNLFPNNKYPEGQIMEYKDENAYRTTNEEKRYLDRMNDDFLTEYRQAAEVHRQTRQYIQKSIKPGQTLTEIAEGIEDSVRALTGHWGLEEGDNLRGGVAFPTGTNINHCAAHYSPNSGNKMVLQYGDVMKVDFGVHVNGRILDSAFTVAFDPVYDPLLNAVKDATNTGVKVP